MAAFLSVGRRRVRVPRTTGAGFPRRVLHRLAGAVVLVAVAASLTYLLAAATLRPEAELASRTPRPPRRVVHARLTRLGLDPAVPLRRRYAHWARGVLHGDFGTTIDGVPVGAELGRRMGVSLRLLLFGGLLGGVVGALLGTYGAVASGRIGDRLVTLGSFVLLAVPAFVSATLLQTAVHWVSGQAGVEVFGHSDVSAAGRPATVWEYARRLLPALTVALGQIPVVARYQRAAMLDAMNAGFVRTALAVGLRRRTVLVRHVARLALVPLAGYLPLTLGALFTGTFVTEKVFGLHGLGEWLIDSIGRNDVNSVAAIGCLAAVVVVFAGLVSEAATMVLDPRVRRS